MMESQLSVYFWLAVNKEREIRKESKESSIKWKGTTEIKAIVSYNLYF